MTMSKTWVLVPALSMTLAACAGGLGSSIPTAENMNIALSTAESPEQRCLLNADFVENEPAHMRPEDLAAGFNTIQGNGGAIRSTPFVSIAYDGYSKRSAGFEFFMKNADPLKARLYRAYELSAKFKGAELGDDPVQLVSPLEMVESAMLALDAGDPDCAAVMFDAVTEVGEARASASSLQRLFQDGKLRGYEQVMLTNYRALSYLLTSDRNAIAAARAARSVLEYQREKYASELAKINNERDAEASKNANNTNYARNTMVKAIFDAGEIKKGRQRADTIKSPYLNPLSDYMSAMMAEIEATQQPIRKRAEWDTARISLQNAAQLLPGNQFIRSSLQKVRGYKANGVPEGKKTVHVIAATGFAPREKIVYYTANLGGNQFFFNIDTLAPVNTYSGPIYAQVGGARSNLELLADVEAMAFRWEKDRMTARIIKQGVIALAGFYASVKAKQKMEEQGGIMGALGGLAQLAVSAGTAAATKPSTESWTSMPGLYRATRMEVPASAKSVKLGIKGPNGDINSVSFDLLPSGTSVIYVRVINNKIWGQSTNVPFGEGRVKRPTKSVASNPITSPQLGR